MSICIDGKSFVFCGWAECASLDTNLSTVEVMKLAKQMRKKDFVQIVALKFAEYLRQYERKLNTGAAAYVPEITSKYMIDFANSDEMQCDLNTIKYIIDGVKKIYKYNSTECDGAGTECDIVGTECDSTKDNVIQYVSSTCQIDHLKHIENEQYAFIKVMQLAYEYSAMS